MQHVVREHSLHKLHQVASAVIVVLPSQLAHRHIARNRDSLLQRDGVLAYFPLGILIQVVVVFYLAVFQSGEVLHTGSYAHRGINRHRRVVHHSREQHGLYGRAGVVEVRAGDILVGHLSVLVIHAVPRQIAACQHISRRCFHQYGATGAARGAAASVQRLPQRGLCYILISGVYRGHDVGSVHTFSLLLVAGQRVRCRLSFAVYGGDRNPHSACQSAAFIQTILSSKHAIIKTLQPCRHLVVVIAKPYAVLRQVAIDMLSALAYDARPVAHQLHNEAAPSFKSYYLVPGRIGYVAFYQKAARRLFFGSLRVEAVAVVLGVASQTSQLSQQRADGVDGFIIE